MLHDFIVAFVALIMSATGALAHDAQSIATSFADRVSPATATSVSYARAPDASQTAAAAASATFTDTDANSNSPSNNQDSTRQHIPSLSSAPSSATQSPGAAGNVASPNEATIGNDENASPASDTSILAGRLNSLIGIVRNLATLIPVSGTPQQQPAASAGWTIADGNNLNPYAAASAVSALANTTITTPTVSNPTVTGPTDGTKTSASHAS